MSSFVGIDISATSFDLVVREHNKSNKSKSSGQSFEGHQG